MDKSRFIKGIVYHILEKQAAACYILISISILVLMEHIQPVNQSLSSMVVANKTTFNILA